MANANLLTKKPKLKCHWLSNRADLKRTVYHPIDNLGILDYLKKPDS